MTDLTKIYIDLSKLSEDQIRTIRQLLFEKREYVPYFTNLFEIDRYYKLHLDNGDWLCGDVTFNGKTELTYPEFIKLLEGGEEENNGWIKIESEADVPKDFIDNGTEVWLSRNKIPFIGCFYRSYGGLNYTVYNLDSVPKEIKGIHMGNFKLLDGYQPIQIPEPPKF